MRIKKISAILLAFIMAVGLLHTQAGAASANPGRLVKEFARYEFLGEYCTQTTTYAYDQNGNISKKSNTQTWESYEGSGSYTTTTTYTYDSHGNVVKEISDGDSISYSYQYDTSGRIVRKVADRGGTWVEITSNYQYNAQGKPIYSETEVIGGENYTSKYSYDQYGNMISDECNSYLEGYPISSSTVITPYTYDQYGNILSGKSVFEGLESYDEKYVTYTYEYLGPKVVLSKQNLNVDGEQINCEKYNIDGFNYFKLRDLAYLLTGTGSQFSVGWNAASNTVSIVTGERYTPNGTELKTGKDSSASAVASRQTILIDGAEVSNISVFNIGGNNYFKLRDLGEVLGFDVDYDQATSTAIVYS